MCADELYIVKVLPTEADTCPEMNHVSIKMIGLNSSNARHVLRNDTQLLGDGTARHACAVVRDSRM